MNVWTLSALLLLAACGGEEDDTGTKPTADAVEDDTATEGGPGEAGDTSDDPCAAEVDVTWSGWTQGFFRSYCTSCHSVTTPERWGAPEGLNFDTEADVTSRVAQIRSAVLDRQSMPVGGGVIGDDLQLLEIYLDCGL
jgi:hypothetical protein